MKIDTIEFFDQLAKLMSDDPNKYELLGDIDLDLAVVMQYGDGGAFAVQLGFHGIECESVAAIGEGAEAAAECWLEGTVEDWQSMFANIVDNGQATGKWTLNSLTMMGDQIALKASDPMGWDKFHRFNQTLQDFVDASTSILDKEASDVSS